MLFLLLLFKAGVIVCAASTLKSNQALDEYVRMFKDFAHLPSQIDEDHFAGLQEIAREAENFWAKTANATALLVEHCDVDKEQCYAAVEKLRSYFRENYDQESSVSLSSVVGFAPFCAIDGSVCEKIDEDVAEFFNDAQSAITFRYSSLNSALLLGGMESLKDFCTEPSRFDATRCMLMVYATVIGKNCVGPARNECPPNITLWRGQIDDANVRWELPQSIHECVNEQVERVSNNGSVLNRLAKYARRNAFLAFNFVSLCSYFSHSPDDTRRESVKLVRSIADGLERSMQSIESNWSTTAKIAAAKILKAAGLKLTTPSEDTSYNETAYAIVSELKRTWFGHEYSVVVHYGYTGPLEDSAFVFKGKNVSSFAEGIGNIKAFGSRSQLGSAKNASDRWNSNFGDDVKRIAALMLSESSPSLETRFRNVEAKLNNALLAEDGFSAVVLVHCAYRFVWYELAWYYFQAYGTTSSYVIEYRDDNRYKPMCGVVILLP